VTALRPLDAQSRKLLAEAVHRWHMALVTDGDNPGAKYLQGRGIGHATAVRHRLGYASAEATIPGYERFTDHVIIPYLAADGHAMGFKARALDPEASVRYSQPAGQTARMFNVRALIEAVEVVAITEGEFDTITLTHLGIPAVAVQGATSFKPHHAKMLEGFRRVVLFKDHDANEAGEKLEYAIRRFGPDIPLQAVYPPGGHKDVNEAHVAGLDQELVDIVRGAQ
jgi:DNA primase